uniref:Family with sequence similarity 98 member B n=1 Tax=Sphenodon punctatus TaxID=8508 RepID=A0A8D0HSZ9_SPHPU
MADTLVNSLSCYSEYECRRRMLIKRLDVTVQSFGWSDRAKVSMFYHLLPRYVLTPKSTITLAHLLAAREDLSKIIRTSSGSTRENTACAVNKVLMGRVPDRGGRPSEIEPPPPEMPPWQKRQEGGGRVPAWGAAREKGQMHFEEQGSGEQEGVVAEEEGDLVVAEVEVVSKGGVIMAEEEGTVGEEAMVIHMVEGVEEEGTEDINCT